MVMPTQQAITIDLSQQSTYEQEYKLYVDIINKFFTISCEDLENQKNTFHNTLKRMKEEQCNKQYENEDGRSISTEQLRYFFYEHFDTILSNPETALQLLNCIEHAIALLSNHLQITIFNNQQKLSMPLNQILGDTPKIIINKGDNTINTIFIQKIVEKYSNSFLGMFINCFQKYCATVTYYFANQDQKYLIKDYLIDKRPAIMQLITLLHTNHGQYNISSRVNHIINGNKPYMFCEIAGVFRLLCDPNQEFKTIFPFENE
jgi:hypothetical protein